MKIGIVTLYRGYNYGTSLQAYALKTFVRSLGYDAQIVWTVQGSRRGRDIRLIKILRILWRCLWHPSLLKHTICAYTNSFVRPISPEIKQKFLEFAQKYLGVVPFSLQKLKDFAADPQTLAFICGSDQIWSATIANVDPLYYLRFAPVHKRIAYAPSFGSKTIPSYNRPIIARYIQDIPYISVREESGVQLVKQLTGRTVPALLDPTLLLDWKELTAYERSAKYILAYFLDEPSQQALETLKTICKKYHYQILALPYVYESFNSLPHVEYVNAGPEEFISLIKGAKCVFTDSFHGTIFSVNLQTPFLTFERNYAAGKGQSDRITTILQKLGLSAHYIAQTSVAVSDIPTDTETLQKAKQQIEMDRESSRRFLLTALQNIGGYNAK